MGKFEFDVTSSLSLDYVEQKISKATSLLTSIDSLDKMLLEIVETSTGLLGGMGGAYGILTPSGNQLLVKDSFPDQNTDRRIQNTFALPVDWTKDSGWHRIACADKFWSADLDDSRFTSGFRDYHSRFGRTHFDHIPIMITGEPRGFFGFGFSRSIKPTKTEFGLVRIMVQHAGLAIHMSQLARQDRPDDNRSGQRSDFAKVTEQKINELILGGRWTELRTDRLANQFGYSTGHFQKLFLNAHQVAPHRYVMNRRLALAHTLLKAGHSVGSVALKCGFADHAHLAKCYRLQYGCSPSKSIR